MQPARAPRCCAARPHARTYAHTRAHTSISLAQPWPRTARPAVPPASVAPHPPPRPAGQGDGGRGRHCGRGRRREAHGEGRAVGAGGRACAGARVWEGGGGAYTVGVRACAHMCVRRVAGPCRRGLCALFPPLLHLTVVYTTRARRCSPSRCCRCLTSGTGWQTWRSGTGGGARCVRAQLRVPVCVCVCGHARVQGWQGRAGRVRAALHQTHPCARPRPPSQAALHRHDRDRGHAPHVPRALQDHLHHPALPGGPGLPGGALRCVRCARACARAPVYVVRSPAEPVQPDRALSHHTHPHTHEPTSHPTSQAHWLAFHSTRPSTRAPPPRPSTACSPARLGRPPVLALVQL